MYFNIEQFSPDELNRVRPNETAATAFMQLQRSCFWGNPQRIQIVLHTAAQSKCLESGPAITILTFTQCHFKTCILRVVFTNIKTNSLKQDFIFAGFCTPVEQYKLTCDTIGTIVTTGRYVAETIRPDRMDIHRGCAVRQRSDRIAKFIHNWNLA